MTTLLLVDCHNILYRSYFAISSQLSANGQIPTNALYGFFQTIFRIVQKAHPTHIIFCLDSKEKTNRATLLETYKANRPVMPDNMIIQMKELLGRILPAMQIPYFSLPGYEADDIIATLVAQYRQEADHVFILSSDRDLWQLLAEDRIKIISPAQDKQELTLFTMADLLEKTGLTPGQVVDYKALTGDPSDNIQGIPGVGPKTAQKWLTEYQSIDELLKSDPPPSPKIRQYQDILRRNQVLIKLDEQVPIERKPFADTAFHDWDWSQIEPILQRYQFHSLMKRFMPSEQKESVFSDENSHENTPNSPFEMFWLQESTMFRCDAETIETYDLSPITQDSLFSAPSWLLRIKQRWLSSPVKTIFYDFKSLAHRLFLSEEEVAKILFDDLMLMWYLQDPNRKAYIFSDWLVSFAHDESVTVAAIAHAISMTRQGLDEHQLETVYSTLERPLVACLYAMENRGIALSRKKLAEAKKTLFLEQKTLEETIYRMTGEPFNLQSPKQLGSVLFEKMALPPLKKNKTGYSTDAETLEELSALHPVIPKVLRYREVTKVLNTYLEPMEKWMDTKQLVHTRFIQAGPSTGRITSVNPNLQALPTQSETGHTVRSLFQVRSKENLFISADYSQIDLRVLAHLAQDQTMMAVFQQNEDIHDSTARKLFHLASDEIPTPAMRKLAKTVQFGIIYGMSPFGLSQTLSISDQEAKQFIEAYFFVYKGVQAYIHHTISEARQSGYVRTISGRMRPIPELASTRKSIKQLGERLAVNTTVQGSSADILKIAMIRLEKALPSDSGMVLTVHDEIVVETPKYEYEKVANLMKDTMEQAWILSVPLSVHISIGTDLGELK